MELEIKAQIDTINKTIKIEEDINLDKLFKAVKVMFPEELWKQFTLKVNTIINWSSPIIIEKPYNPWNPYQPYGEPWITYKDTTGDIPNYTLNPGTYSVNLKLSDNG